MPGFLREHSRNPLHKMKFSLPCMAEFKKEVPVIWSHYNIFSGKHWRTWCVGNIKEDWTQLLGCMATSLIHYIWKFKMISLFFSTSVCGFFFFPRGAHHLVDIAAEDPAGFLFYVQYQVSVKIDFMAVCLQWKHSQTEALHMTIFTPVSLKRHSTYARDLPRYT